MYKRNIDYLDDKKKKTARRRKLKIHLPFYEGNKNLKKLRTSLLY